MKKNKTQSSQNTRERQSSDIEKLQRPQSFPKLPSRNNRGRQEPQQESKPPKDPPKTPKKTSK